MPGQRRFELVAQDECGSPRTARVGSRNAIYMAVPCSVLDPDDVVADVDTFRSAKIRNSCAPGALLLLVLSVICIAFCAVLWRPSNGARVMLGMAARSLSAGHSAGGRSPFRKLGEVCNRSALVREQSDGRVFKLSAQLAEYCENLPNVTAMDGREQYYIGQNKCWAWTKRVGCYNVIGRLSWSDAQLTATRNGKAPNPTELSLHGLQNANLCDRYQHGAAPLPSGDPWEKHNATRWLNQNVATYVLNLDKDFSRLASISKRLDDLGVKFQRIAGVDLSLPDGLHRAYRDGLIPGDFNFTEAQETARTDLQGMGGILGTVGCASAHLNAMRIAAKDVNRTSSSKMLALVLEDDVFLADDFAIRLRRLLEAEAPCNFEAISLQSRCPFGVCVSPHLSRVFPDGNEPSTRCHHGVNYGFFAMLYRIQTLDGLRSKLAKVVWNAERPRCLDVDVALASISDEVAYYAVPSMQTPGFLSEGGHGSSRYDSNQLESTEVIEEAGITLLTPSHTPNVNTTDTTTAPVTSTEFDEAEGHNGRGVVGHGIESPADIIYWRG